MKKSSLSTVSGIFTAIIASLCCIGPVFATIVGIGSIGIFAIFETYRIYLIGLTIVLLGIAYYFVYKKRELQCEDGTCKIQDAGKWNKISIWIATLIAIVAIGFPYLGIAPSIHENTDVIGKASVSLNVVGMDCKPCAIGLEGSLASLQGVRKVHVFFEKGEALIEFDPALSKPEIFIERINENGFSATIKSKKGI